MRKLAAIDEHIHAIDPNWPITAQEPSSPTIFLNPKFLESVREGEGGRGERGSLCIWGKLMVFIDYYFVVLFSPQSLQKDEATAKRHINKITTTATANRDSPPLPKKVYI